jgi:hypothetical protein
MKKLDDLIKETLEAKDQGLQERYGREPGYITQAVWLFRGRLGWVMLLVGIVQLLLFLGAIYALWWTFTADEMIVALRWGVGAVVLVQLSTLLRSFMGMHFETNRVLRELTRVELRLVRLEERWAEYDD